MSEQSQDVSTGTTAAANTGTSQSLDAAAVASGSQASATAGGSSPVQSAYTDASPFTTSIDIEPPSGKASTLYGADSEKFINGSAATPESAGDSTSATTADCQSQPAQADAAQDQADATSAFDAQLLDTARWYGLTDEEAKAFGTPDTLRRVLTAMDRRDVSAAQSQSQQTEQVEGAAGRQPEATAQAAAPQAPAPQEVSLAQLTGDVEKFNLEPLLEGWDDDTKKLFSQLNDHYDAQMRKIAAKAKAISPVNEQVTQLQQQLAALEDFRLREEGARIEQEFDGLFGSLGDEFADSFGKQAARELPLDSKQLQARRELVQEMNALAEVDRRFNRPPLNRKQLFERALAVRNFNKTQDLAVKKVQAQVAQRQQQAVAKPTQRKPTAVTGVHSAVDFVNQFLAERGIQQGNASELMTGTN